MVPFMRVVEHIFFDLFRLIRDVMAQYIEGEALYLGEVSRRIDDAETWRYINHAGQRSNHVYGPAISSAVKG